ncbi:hypothetical protein Ga0123461_0525 [Mariprofundus aestuarium]|uniref:Uncharacterized protein n=1 Tax=Mariprofundus aestuarium TaxID=1921086 RepID=A0A2K8KWD1_MARES|nr:hypothetical protein [Mariprofundus aestuarium]ATX78962.1 hypothetical protein Ga0123461_0525 [Mariprofundus aestuarium]
MRKFRVLIYAVLIAFSVPASAAFADVSGFCDCSAAEENGGKVKICHFPPGNQENAHTIEVGAPAVKAHLKHGDLLGECEGDEVVVPLETGTPCICADGSVGVWVHGEVKGPASMREVHGK